MLETLNFHQTQIRLRLDQNQKKNWFDLNLYRYFMVRLVTLTWNSDRTNKSNHTRTRTCYTCSLCRYVEKSNLKAHLQTTHYACDQWEFKTSWKRELREHSDSVHGKLQCHCDFRCLNETICLNKKVFLFLKRYSFLAWTTITCKAWGVLHLLCGLCIKTTSCADKFFCPPPWPPPPSHQWIKCNLVIPLTCAKNTPLPPVTAPIPFSHYYKHKPRNICNKKRPFLRRFVRHFEILSDPVLLKFLYKRPVHLSQWIRSCLVFT